MVASYGHTKAPLWPRWRADKAREPCGRQQRACGGGTAGEYGGGDHRHGGHLGARATGLAHLSERDTAPPRVGQQPQPDLALAALATLAALTALTSLPGPRPPSSTYHRRVRDRRVGDEQRRV